MMLRKLGLALGLLTALTTASEADEYFPSPQPLSNSGAPVVAFMGDSITARGANIGATTIASENIGFAYWVGALTGYRVWSPVYNNFGINGNSTPQMLARMSSMLAVHPDICIFEAAINDVQGLPSAGPDTTPGTVEYNLRQMYDEAQAANCIVIAVTIPSVTTFSYWNGGGNSELIALQVNEWIRRQKTFRKGFYVADLAASYDDPTNTTHWAPRTNFGDPNSLPHPMTWGAYAQAVPVAAIINALYPQWRAGIANVDDVYNATYNPTGNLLPNQMFTGNGGGFSGGGTTSGSIASGWTVFTNSLLGSAVAASKTAWSDGSPAQTLVISGTANGSGGIVSAEIGMTAGNFNVGDTIECRMLAAWGATTNISMVRLMFQDVENSTADFLQDGDNDASSPQAGYSLPTDTTNANAPASLSIALITPQWKVASTVSFPQLWLQIGYVTPLSSATVAGTFQFAKPECRKVPVASP